MKTRAKSEGFARRTRDQKPVVFGAGVRNSAAAVQPALPGHCLDSKGGFYSATRRQRTGAAELATEHYMVERPS